MINKEKVINGLKYCASNTQCESCPYFTDVSNCMDSLMTDALELIKELKEEINFLKFTQSHDIIGMRDSQGNLF